MDAVCLWAQILKSDGGNIQVSKINPTKGLLPSAVMIEMKERNNKNSSLTT
jgi:hypothetical protein